MPKRHREEEKEINEYYSYFDTLPKDLIQHLFIEGYLSPLLAPFWIEFKAFKKSEVIVNTIESQNRLVLVNAKDRYKYRYGSEEKELDAEKDRILRSLVYSTRNGYLAILHWFIEAYPSQESSPLFWLMIENYRVSLCKEAAANGHVEVLHWLIGNAPSIAPYRLIGETCWDAAGTNCQLSVLKWLHATKMSRPYFQTHTWEYSAINNDRLDLLDWFWQERIFEVSPESWCAMIYSNANLTDRKTVIDWVKTKAPGLEVDVFKSAKMKNE